MNKQRGYTLTELLIVIVFFLALIIVVAGGIIAIHFLLKFW